MIGIPQVDVQAVNQLDVLDAHGARYFFSYRTCIAVRYDGRTVVRENDWGPTTGKHLNAIDGGGAAAKRARLSGDDFHVAVAELLG